MPETIKLQEALAAYDFAGEVISCERFGEGHINDTFAAVVKHPDGSTQRWIVQRINTHVFKKPLEVMENIIGVTDFLAEKIDAAGGDAARETLYVLRTKEGKPIFADSEGGIWRCYRFIEGTICLQQVKDPADFYNSALTFGNFQRQLEAYPAKTLHETIPNFHNTPDRYQKFEAAVAEDSCKRAANVADEIAFVRARKADCAVLSDLLAANELPLRVTHNDTKLNNILIDAATGKGLCVIDLDTVMPGLAAHDYGDSIRFGASTAKEDETDLSKVHFSLPLFETYTKGYLEAAGDALTEKEKETLRWGAKLMTLECGMRFLTDYLQGDVYFKTTHPEHNLERCHTQFRLVEEMEDHWDEMQQIIRNYSK